MKRQELVVCVPGLAQLSGSEAELTGKENLQRERGEERRGEAAKVQRRTGFGSRQGQPPASTPHTLFSLSDLQPARTWPR